MDGQLKTEKRLTVSVTAKDIRQGIRRDAHYCPLALALRRHFPNAADLYVLPARALIKPTALSQHIVARLSQRATAFVEAFDGSKKNVGPATFRLLLTLPPSVGA